MPSVQANPVRFVISLAFLLIVTSTVSHGANLDRLQYGQQNRYHITLCARGEYKAALDYARDYLVGHPDDLEAYYILAMAQANLGQTDAALETVKTSINKGLTFDRYLAGPRDLFTPLYAHPGFKELVAQQSTRLIHGPVLGSLTNRRARFWVRSLGKTITVSVHTKTVVKKMRIVGEKVAEGSATIGPDDDNTAVVEVTGLEPNTHYTYFVSVDGKPIPLAPAPTFNTFPPKGETSEFEIVFGGGAGFIPWNERMWTTLESRRPLAALLLGDNVYIDTPEVSQTQRYCYYRRQSRPEYRHFAARTPIFAIWDDHDFGKDDCVSSPALDEPLWKMDVLKVFTENFVNPYYGSSAKQPGCYFDFSIGDVDFIMLDCRFYRQNPKLIKNPSMLGSTQRAWLYDRLNNSKATFKVIASSVPWASGTKPGSKDTWDGFPDEREEIFSFLKEKQIEGVVLISADRHRSDAWKIERPGAYDLHDFSSSKLTNGMSHPLMKGSLFGYNEKCSAGSLIFDTRADDPTVTYRIINIDGDVMNTLTLSASQLKFKNP